MVKTLLWQSAGDDLTTIYLANRKNGTVSGDAMALAQRW